RHQQYAGQVAADVRRRFCVRSKADGAGDGDPYRHSIPPPSGGGGTGGKRMKRVRAIVVDDERLAREGLEKLLRRDPEGGVVGTAADGKTAVALIEEQDPDIVFLDVQIPGLDGFGVVSTIGVEKMPVLVFVTAYDQYTLKAFEVHALDYLMKPFDETRFAL